MRCLGRQRRRRERRQRRGVVMRPHNSALRRRGENKGAIGKHIDGVGLPFGDPASPVGGRREPATDYIGTVAEEWPLLEGLGESCQFSYISLSLTPGNARLMREYPNRA